MSVARLHLDHDLAAGVRLALDAAQANYLANVLRLKPGAGLRVFNGRDGEWAARLLSASRKAAEIDLVERVRPQGSGKDLALLFAPVKRQGTDWIVEKATELGVARLQPVLTRRTIAETVRIDRLALIAREAAEQTERLDVPEISPPQSLARALDGWDMARPLLYADEAGDEAQKPWGGTAGRAPPMAAALMRMKPPALALLIGPEGGFEPDERRLLRSLPFVTPVSLGPRILRAETAATAALAVIQALWGDWA
jgi:16S rRNA (uracil1498-N3)-methyltransferase